MLLSSFWLYWILPDFDGAASGDQGFFDNILDDGPVASAKAAAHEHWNANDIVREYMSNMGEGFAESVVVGIAGALAIAVKASAVVVLSKNICKDITRTLKARTELDVTKGTPPPLHLGTLFLVGDINFGVHLTDLLGEAGAHDAAAVDLVADQHRLA